MRCVVQFSGGVGSWAAARRLIQLGDYEAVTLLFADTLIEDEDLYRFLDDAVTDLRALGAERDVSVGYHRIADGRTPWEVFRDRRFIGNTRVARHEAEEEITRVAIGKDVSVLRDRSKAGVAAYEAEHGPIVGQKTKTVPLTLRQFRERLGVDPSDFDPDEWGGCGCAID